MFCVFLCVANKWNIFLTTTYTLLELNNPRFSLTLLTKLTK